MYTSLRYVLNLHLKGFLTLGIFKEMRQKSCMQCNIYA
jgi:hypothetical protein